MITYDWESLSAPAWSRVKSVAMVAVLQFCRRNDRSSDKQFPHKTPFLFLYSNSLQNFNIFDVLKCSRTAEVIRGTLALVEVAEPECSSALAE